MMSIYILFVVWDRRVKGDIYYLRKTFKIVNEYVKGLGFTSSKCSFQQDRISSDYIYMVKCPIQSEKVYFHYYHYIVPFLFFKYQNVFGIKDGFH